MLAREEQRLKAEPGYRTPAATLRKLQQGDVTPQPQDNSQATFAPLLKKIDGLIDWNMPAGDIYNRIRGLQPWPGAFTTFRGKNCQIWGKPLVQAGAIEPTKSGNFVACGNASALRLEYLQLEGRNRVTAQEFVNGAHLTAGERFGD